MFSPPRRRTPPSVMSPARASSAARLEGADTEATIGIRAISAFCTISKPARPLTSKMWRSRRRGCEGGTGRGALVAGVVAAAVLAQDEQPAHAVEEAGGVETPGLLERALGRAQRRLQRIEEIERHSKGRRDRCRVGQDPVDGCSPAESARR